MPEERSDRLNPFADPGAPAFGKDRDDPVWIRASAGTVPAENEAHVWRLRIGSIAPETESALPTYLSADEKARGERFCLEKHHRRFELFRGLLRRILGLYLDLEPGRLSFRIGEHGKPELADAGLRAKVSFNVSHSGDTALFAFTKGDRCVGVDIERIRANIDHEGIARRFFSDRENAALRLLPEEERIIGFFRCWTRKEAYLKAKGVGVAHGMSRFSVSLAPGELACLISNSDYPQDVGRWTLCDLRVEPGYAAALAVSGSAVILRRFDGPIA